MSSHRPIHLDTTGEIRDYLNTIEDERDTDSLSESDEYEPSPHEVMTMVEEKTEDEYYYSHVSQNSEVNESDRVYRTEPESAKSNQGFGKGKKRKLKKKHSTPQQPRQNILLPSPAQTPQPVSHSTPTAPVAPVDEGEEADVEDVGGVIRRSTPCVGARRRLYSACPGDVSETSDPDDPPPHIISPPRSLHSHRPGSPLPSTSHALLSTPPGALHPRSSRTDSSSTRLPSQPITHVPSDLSDTNEAPHQPAARRRAVGLRHGCAATRGRVSQRGRARPATVIRRSRSRSRSRSLSASRTFPAGTPAVDPLPGPIRVDDDWTWDDVGGFVPRTYQFIPVHQPGPVINYDPEDTSRSSIFKQIFTNNLVEQIVKTTNLYTTYRVAGKVLGPKSRYLDVEPVSVDELYIFLAVSMLMSSCKKNAIQDYWTTDILLETPGFRKSMPRDRFLSIMCNLHFIDSLKSHTTNQDRPREEKDPMERIRPVYNYVKTKLKAAFNPYQKLVIDESLCLWRGNISFRQYIPSKRHRYGLKTFVLCDCKTGYVQDFLLYLGGKTELTASPANIGVSGAVVCTLLEDYLNQGRILYTDNWYTSPALCLHLNSLGTGSCGIVRRNCQHLPALPSKREENSIIYKCANGVLLLSWIDNKEVNVLSTVHAPVQERSRRCQRGTGEHKLKPQAINDYNINMRLVDKKDAVVASAACARKTLRWYKKLFFHLLDVTLYDCCILYTQLTGVRETRENFCVELARELLQQHRVQPLLLRAHQRLQVDPSATHLTERHFLEFVPHSEKKANPRRKCYVCRVVHNKRKDTRYFCPDCNLGFCFSPCFKDYHTKEHL